MADSLMLSSQPQTDPSAPFTPDQNKALAAVNNGQQQPPASADMNGITLLQPQIEALGKVLAKANMADAEKHLQEVGLQQANADHQELLAKLGSMGSFAQGGKVQTMPSASQMPGVPSEDKPKEDPRGSQSPEIQKQNDQLKKDAYEILHPTSWFGKILSATGLGQEWQGRKLDNLSKALTMGGGDPQGEYYKAYSGTMKQIMTGDQPLGTEKRAELTGATYAAKLNAVKDAQTQLMEVAKVNMQAAEVSSKNKGMLENVAAGGGFTPKMQAAFDNNDTILNKLIELNNYTRTMANNPMQYNKAGAVPPAEASTPPAPSNDTSYKVINKR